MTPILMNGPAIEPVTLAEAKNWLRIDQTEDDALIQTLITSARLVVEANARVMMIAQTWRLVMDSWPSSPAIAMQLKPLISFDAVRVKDSAGNPQIVPPQTYLEDKTPNKARICFLSVPPTPGVKFAGIEIDLTLGFGPSASDVPGPLRQAIRLLLARWYENRGDTETDAQNLPAAVESIVAPWRSARLI